MAIVRFHSLSWLSPFLGAGGGPSVSSSTLTVVNDKMAMVFQAPRTGTVYQVGYTMASVTTNNNTTLTIEGMTSATGIPDGVNIGGSNTTNTHAVGWNVKTPASSFSVTSGLWYAVVISNPNTASLGFRSNTDHIAANYLRKYTSAGGTWADIGGAIALGLNYSNGGDDWDWPDPGFGPVSSETSFSLSTSQTWDEAGLKFQLPASCRLSSCIIWADVNVDATVTLYDASDTVLATGTYFNNMPFSVNPVLNKINLSADVTLAANTDYRLTFKSTTSTSNILYYWIATGATVLSNFGGIAYLTKRKSSGAWTDTTAERPYFILSFNGVEVSAGGGGAAALFGSSIIRPGGLS